jgi:oligoribonuclease
MHEENGLLADIRSNGVSSQQAQSAVLEWLRETVPEDRELVHCGYYVELDRLVLSREWPAVREEIGYRVLDVRTLEEAADAWSPNGRFARTRSGGHRAAGDVDEAIELSRRYAPFFD